MIQILTPTIDLLTEVDFHRAHIRTGETERAGRYIIAIPTRILEHPQIDPDRPGDKISVGITAGATIDGTRIHTCTASYAVERFYVLLIFDDVRPSVVHDDIV